MRYLVRKMLVPLGFVLASAFAPSDGVWAGGGGLDESFDEDRGTPFFGFAKDLSARGRGIPDTRLTAQVKNANASLVTLTDAQGHFRLGGFGKEIDPDRIEITCVKDGYSMERTARRKLSSDKGAPVEVDCLMAKQ